LCRVCRVFFCIVRVRVLPTDIVGEAAGVGVVVGNAAGVGVIVGDTAGADGITAGVCSASVAAGTCCGVGLFAIPNTIATTAEKIPTIPIPIAKRARRCVCSCRASPCLRSISLRISDSRSDCSYNFIWRKHWVRLALQKIILTIPKFAFRKDSKLSGLSAIDHFPKIRPICHNPTFADTPGGILAQVPVRDNAPGLRLFTQPLSSQRHQTEQTQHQKQKN
jgi:hypothetical protein